MSEATGWSTSYRWEGVTRGDAKGLANHDLRQPGVTQSNPDVDRSRTHLNEVRLADGSGGWRSPEPGEDAVATAMSMLDLAMDNAVPNMRKHKVKKVNPDTGRKEETGGVRDVPVAHRKDAAAMTEFLFQLDPQFTGTSFQFDENGRMPFDADGEPVVKTCADMTPEKRAEAAGLLDAMITEAQTQHPNFVWLYIAIHWDETSPHATLTGVPLTADGRINMTEVFDEGKTSKVEVQGAWSAKHDRMRERLQEHGYDATMVRVDKGKKHLGLAASKRQATQAAKAHEALLKQRDKNQADRAILQIFNDQSKSQFEAAQATLQTMEAALNAREAKVAASEGEAVKVIVSAKADAQVMLDDARGYADRVRTHTQEALEITRKGVESIFSDAFAAADAEADAATREFLAAPGVKPVYDKFMAKKRGVAVKAAVKPLSERYNYQFEDQPGSEGDREMGD